MKWIYYKLSNGEEKGLTYTERNLEIAIAEADNGEYEIYDDGEQDHVDTPTLLDMIEAQVAYTAMMTNTLLEV